MHKIIDPAPSPTSQDWRRYNLRLTRVGQSFINVNDMHFHNLGPSIKGFNHLWEIPPSPLCTHEALLIIFTGGLTDVPFFTLTAILLSYSSMIVSIFIQSWYHLRDFLKIHVWKWNSEFGNINKSSRDKVPIFLHTDWLTMNQNT